MSDPGTTAELLERLKKRGLRVFGLFGVLTLVGALLDVDQFLHSWLLAFLYWIAFPLGSFAILQIYHMTGGAWGKPAKRVLEGAARTIPLFVVLFLPLAVGCGRLYKWAHEEVVAHDPLLQHKQAYLNVPFFLGRAATYLLAWCALVWIQDRLTRRRETDHDVRLMHKQRTIAAPATGIFALTMTFAAFDWAMSLEPHWFSSIYGVAFIVGQGLTGFALSIVAGATLVQREPAARVFGADHFHDLGKLMFAFVLLWAYVAYSQFLLIWSGNLLEEIPWYIARTTGGWQWVALFLIAFHFALPFLILLGRRTKRNPRTLIVIAGGLLALRWLDLLWYIAPAFHPGALRVHWLDVAATGAVGGLWCVAFARQLEGRSLVEPTTPLEKGDAADASEPAVAP